MLKPAVDISLRSPQNPGGLVKKVVHVYQNGLYPVKSD
jgi:hypothetical protein